MRELEIKLVNLTSGHQTPYSKGVPRLIRGRDIFMATEGQSDMHPANSQPTNLEHAEKTSFQEPAPEAMQKRARKAWGTFNQDRVLSLGERRTTEELIKRGVRPAITVAQDIGKEGIQNPSIAAEIDAINNSIDVGLPPLNVLIKGLENISRLVGVDATEKQTAIDKIRTAIASENQVEEIRRERSRPEEERERRFSLYFMPADLKRLSENPTEWLDEEFSKLYALAEEGQELSSPLIQDTQGKVAQALDVIKHSKPEILPEFIAQFTIRLHLLQTRTAIGYKNMDQIKGAAGELRTHGLLAGMTLEKGMVGAMFNRFQDLLESTRLSSNARHHVMLEDAYKLQGTLIEEQMDFAKKGVGNFGDLRDIATKEVKDQDPNNPDTWDDFTWATKKTDKQIEENKEMSEEKKGRIIRIKGVNASITRSIRTAYDVFVSSQRMAVVVARGKYLFSDSAYRSDPIGALNVYNMEALLFEKFDLYSPEQEEMVDRMKLDMADTYLKEQEEEREKSGKQGVSRQELSQEERLDLGKRLFRDIFAVPDFFSSGWRIDGVTTALEQRFGDKAKDFALFMRLRKAKPGDRENMWGKIQEFRPEEVVRLFRERKNDKLAELYKEMISIDSTLDLDHSDKKNNLAVEEGGRGKDIKVYDKFKRKYGAAIGFLRQEGFNLKDSDGLLSPMQINLSRLTDAQIETVDKLLGSGGGQKLTELVAKMQSFIETESLIRDLCNDNNFADVYTRSIIIDDALLDKLEDEKPATDDNVGYAPLSKIIGEAGAGGDTLVRSWNDTENAAKAGNSLIKFIKEEDVEKKMGASIEFATFAAAYNGLGARGQAECVRYTIGTFLNLSKIDMVWDIVGLTSLGRVSISDVQRIFGPQAKAMSRDELRGHADHLRGFLNSSITKAREKLQEDLKAVEVSALYKNEEARDKKRKELKAGFAEHEEESHKFYIDLENLFEVNAGDTAKRFGMRLLFYLLLAAIGETYMVGKSSFKDGAK